MPLSLVAVATFLSLSLSLSPILCLSPSWWQWRKRRPFLSLSLSLSLLFATSFLLHFRIVALFFIWLLRLPFSKKLIVAAVGHLSRFLQGQWWWILSTSFSFSPILEIVDCCGGVGTSLPLSLFRRMCYRSRRWELGLILSVLSFLPLHHCHCLLPSSFCCWEELWQLASSHPADRHHLLPMPLAPLLLPTLSSFLHPNSPILARLMNCRRRRWQKCISVIAVDFLIVAFFIAACHRHYGWDAFSLLSSSSSLICWLLHFLFLVVAIVVVVVWMSIARRMLWWRWFPPRIAT